jgi:hypothetical protein
LFLGFFERLLFGSPATEIRVSFPISGPMTNPISRKADGCDSWENLRNLLNRNEPIRHQLGKKPHEINAALGTHAPQQDHRGIEVHLPKIGVTRLESSDRASGGIAAGRVASWINRKWGPRGV